MSISAGNEPLLATRSSASTTAPSRPTSSRARCARRAASRTPPTSKTRRASMSSVTVAADSGACSAPSEARATTNVPLPIRASTRPRAASAPTAWRTVGLLTPKSAASARSAGRRSPGSSSPLRMSTSNSCATNSCALRESGGMRAEDSTTVVSPDIGAPHGSRRFLCWVAIRCRRCSPPETWTAYGSTAG